MFEESSVELIESLEELIYIYYDLYLKNNNSENYFKKLNYYINLIEKHNDYNDEIASRINNKLKSLKNKHLKIELP